MKLLTHLFTLLLLSICSCGPKNEEVTDEQVETGSRTQVLDSIAGGIGLALLIYLFREYPEYFYL